MKLLTTLAASTAVLATMGTAAFAADVTPMVVTMVEPAPVAPAPAFSWGGVYAGIGTSYAWFTFPSEEFHLTGYLGANFNQPGSNFLFGVEAYATAAWELPFGGGPFARLGAEARAGVLLTPTVLAYGALGVAYYPPTGNLYLTAGPGVEFALGDSLSVDIAYDFEYGLNVGANGHRVTAALNFHFGQ